MAFMLLGKKKVGMFKIWYYDSPVPASGMLSLGWNLMDSRIVVHSKQLMIHMMVTQMSHCHWINTLFLVVH
jgi:hypothetical protein